MYVKIHKEMHVSNIIISTVGCKIYHNITDACYSEDIKGQLVGWIWSVGHFVGLYIVFLKHSNDLPISENKTSHKYLDYCLLLEKPKDLNTPYPDFSAAAACWSRAVATHLLFLFINMSFPICQSTDLLSFIHLQYLPGPCRHLNLGILMNVYQKISSVPW